LSFIALLLFYFLCP